MGLSPKRRCGGGNANRRGCPLLVFRVGILSKPQRLNPSGKQEELPSRSSNAALAQYPPRIPAFNNPIPNILGKNIVAVVVDYPPGVSNPPHHHTGSAFVTAYVLQGAVRSQSMMGRLMSIMRAIIARNPGSHHRLSENASKTDPTRLLAIFVLDTGNMPITTPEK